MMVGNAHPIEAQRLEDRLMLRVEIGQHPVEALQCFRILPLRDVILSQPPYRPHFIILVPARQYERFVVILDCFVLVASLCIGVAYYREQGEL